jgi:CRISPR-associated protein Cmr3
MRYQIESEDLLIFRDGRPFGEAGTFGGFSLTWPNPQTITGMMRTAIGHAQSEDFFDSKNPKHKANIEQIMTLGLTQILPMQRSVTASASGNWQALLPLPADILLTQSDENKDAGITVHQAKFSPLNEQQGTDILNKDWLYSFIDSKKKPARNMPFFCHGAFYNQYLRGGLNEKESYQFDQIGIAAPVADTRFHNALDSETLTTEKGKLFCDTGFYLKAASSPKLQSGIASNLCDLSIHFNINNNAELTTNQAYLGGERKQVSLNKSQSDFFPMPDIFQQKSWLKIILTTQGDFGNWCPDWLMPDLTQTNIDWVTIPQTDYQVRLRTANIKGWDAISGWNYVTKKPKATRKLVKAGTVYLLEVRNPDESSQIATHLWGNTLCEKNTETANNGYGQCVIGNVTISN